MRLVWMADVPCNKHEHTVRHLIQSCSLECGEIRMYRQVHKLFWQTRFWETQLCRLFERLVDLRDDTGGNVRETNVGRGW